MRRYLPIIEKDVSGRVEQEKILYLIQDLRNVIIVAEFERIQVRGKVEDFAEKLNSDFYRCHSYLAVNLSRVAKMTNCTMMFDNGEELRIGRNNFIKARHAYNAYLMKL